jgi:hypothetical protein
MPANVPTAELEAPAPEPVDIVVPQPASADRANRPLPAINVRRSRLKAGSESIGSVSKQLIFIPLDRQAIVAFAGQGGKKVTARPIVAATDASCRRWVS